MKICFLAAANSIHSHRWVRYFAGKGHEVHWISLAPPDSDPGATVNFHYFKKWAGKHLDAALCVPFVRRWIDKIQPDILHAHYVGTYGLIGALSGFHPFVLTAWGSDILFAGRSRLKGRFVRFALNKADLITCDAHHMTAAMTALGADENLIHLVRFGIDTNLFSPVVTGRADIRQMLGLANSPVIISMRNHEPVYDVATLIRAVPLVLREAPDARFVIAGTGSQTEEMKKIASASGVMGSLIFTGRVQNNELPRYMGAADIYVSTSLSDAGIAASTAEAMSCGLPVVVTDSGENREWIVEGHSGSIVPMSDPATLAERILMLIRDEDRRKAIGKAGREIILTRNDYFTEMDRMESLYRKVINRGQC